MDPPPLPRAHSIPSRKASTSISVYITPSTSPPASRAPITQPLSRTSAPPPKRPRHNSRSSSSFGRASSSSSSVAPDNAFDLHSARVESAERVREVWTHLAEKYSRPLDQDDILDLRTQSVIKDRGFLRAAKEQFEFGCFGDAPVSESEMPDVEAEADAEQDDDFDELDILAPEADISDELTAATLNVPPVRPMDPSDMADLNEFLELEKHRREMFGDLDEEGEVEDEVVDFRGGDGGSSEGLNDGWDDVAEISGAADTSEGMEDAVDTNPAEDDSEDEFAAWDTNEGSMLYQLTDDEGSASGEHDDLVSDSHLDYLDTPATSSPPPQLGSGVRPTSSVKHQASTLGSDPTFLTLSSPPHSAAEPPSAQSERGSSSSPDPEIIPARKSTTRQLSPKTSPIPLPLSARKVPATATPLISARVLQLQTPPRSRSSVMTLDEGPEEDSSVRPNRTEPERSAPQRSRPQASKSIASVASHAEDESARISMAKSATKISKTRPAEQLDDVSEIARDFDITATHPSSRSKAKMREPSHDEDPRASQPSPPRRRHTKQTQARNMVNAQQRSDPSTTRAGKRKRVPSASGSDADYGAGSAGLSSRYTGAVPTREFRRQRSRSRTPASEADDHTSRRRARSYSRSHSHTYSMPPSPRYTHSPPRADRRQPSAHHREDRVNEVQQPAVPFAQDPQASYMFAQAWQYILRGMSVIGGRDVSFPADPEAFPVPPFPPYTPTHRHHRARTRGEGPPDHTSSSSSPFKTPMHHQHPHPLSFTPSSSRGTLPPSSPPPASSPPLSSSPLPPSSPPTSALRGARSKSRGRSKSLVRRVSFHLDDELVNSDDHDPLPSRRARGDGRGDATTPNGTRRSGSQRSQRSVSASARAGVSAYDSEHEPTDRRSRDNYRPRDTPAPPTLKKAARTKSKTAIHISDEEDGEGSSDEDISTLRSSSRQRGRRTERGQTPGPPLNHGEPSPEPVVRAMARRGRSRR